MAPSREYVAHRTAQARRAAKPEITGKPARMVTAAGARRELEDLRSAINYHRTEGLCSEVVSVALPERSEPREDWLTRSEAATLIRAAWRARQKMGFSKMTMARLVVMWRGSFSSASTPARGTPRSVRRHLPLRSVADISTSTPAYSTGVARGFKQTSKRQTPVRLT